MKNRCLTVGEIVTDRGRFESVRMGIGKQQFVNEQRAILDFGRNIYKSLSHIMDKMIEIGKLPANSKEQFLTLSCLKFLSGGVIAFKEFEKINGLDMTDFITEAIAYVANNYVSMGEEDGAYINGLASETLRAIEMSDLQNCIKALKAGKSFTADNGLTLIDEETFSATLWNDYVVVKYMRVWCFKKFGILFDDNVLLCLYNVANKENNDIDIVALTGGVIYYDDKSQLVLKFKDSEGEKLLETGIYSFMDLLGDIIDYHNNVLFYVVISKKIEEYLLECKLKGDESLESIDDVKSYYAANPNKGYFDDDHIYRLFAYYDFDRESSVDVHSDDIRQGSISILNKTVEGTELDVKNATLVMYNGMDFIDFMVVDD